METQSLYNLNFPAERARKLLVFDTFLPLPLRPGRQRWPDLLLPTFLQLHSELSARLAACGSLLSLLPPLQAPPAQSNGGPSKYQQIWIEERESVFQLMNLDYFIFLYFPSTGCLTSSLWHGGVYLAWCRWTVDTPPGVGQVMSVPVSTWLLITQWPVLVSAPVMSAAALLRVITRGYTIITKQIQRKNGDALEWRGQVCLVQTILVTIYTITLSHEWTNEVESCACRDNKNHWTLADVTNSPCFALFIHRW